MDSIPYCQWLSKTNIDTTISSGRQSRLRYLVFCINYAVPRSAARHILNGLRQLRDITRDGVGVLRLSRCAQFIDKI